MALHYLIMNVAQIIRLTTFYMYKAVPSALEFQDNIIVKTKLSLWIIYIDDNNE